MTIKKTVALVFTVSLLTWPGIALAQNQKNQEGRQEIVSDLNEGEMEESPQGNLVQNQVQTKNASEDSQLNVNTQESLGFKAVVERMDLVGEKLEELGDNEGLGVQVGEVVKLQKQAQGEIEQGLNKLETRSMWVKRLLGADSKALGELRKQMEQNEERIMLLQELKTEVANQAEAEQIQEAILAMVEQNNALGDQIRAEEKTKGLFGWLFRLFN